MSYTIHVEMKDGQLAIHSSTGDIPDGKFVISGHEDGTANSISVTHHDHSGATAIYASAHAKKALSGTPGRKPTRGAICSRQRWRHSPSALSQPEV
jgi:hypothetical protein